MTAKYPSIAACIAASTSAPARRAGAVVALLWLLAVPHASAQAAAPRQPDAAVMTALLAAQPGTYRVQGRSLTSASENAMPLFVQVDTYRNRDGATVVPLAIAGGSHEPWAMQYQVQPVAGGAVLDQGRASGAAGRISEVRTLNVRPGTYRATVVVARPADGGAWVGTVAKPTLVVPDLAGGLVTSPIVLGDQSGRATGDPATQPFVFGASTITPAILNIFRQNDRLHLGFRVYGWRADDQAKPDLSVEYVFQQQVGPALRFFNKMKPQELNGKSMVPTFDGRRGVVAAGTVVPLGAFPPGDFQLEVRVTDKRTKQTTRSTARFTVTAS